ncbi:MAG: insulinase family protein [Cellvibrionales bacterium]|nr:insulinase family protein [Cellvibrionales bacterium]
MDHQSSHSISISLIVKHLSILLHQKMIIPVLLCLLSIGLPSIASDNQSLKTYAGDQHENKHITLDNGIDIVIVTDPSEERTSIAISQPVGSFYESPSYGGIARLHQKLLLKQSKNYTEKEGIERFIEEHNGSNLSEVKGSITTFAFTIDNALIGSLLERITDTYNHPVFLFKDCEEKIKGLHSEWYSIKKQARALQDQLLNESTENPQMAHFANGNMMTMKAGEPLTEALFAYHDTQFVRTKNIIAVVTSPRPIKDIEKKITEPLSKIKTRHTTPIEALNELTLSKMGNQYFSIHSNKGQLDIYLPIDSAGNFSANKFPFIFKQILTSNHKDSFTRWLMLNKYASSLDTEFIRWPEGKGFLTISMQLTKEGLNNKPKILSGAKEFLELVRNIKDPSVYHREMQDILRLESFIYKRGQGLDQVKKWAINAQYSPIEHLLISDHVIADFDEEEVRKTLAEIQFSNAIIFDLSSNKNANKTNNYFSTPYDIQNLDAVVSKETESLNFSLHKANKYIPSEFTLNSAGNNKEPEVTYTDGRVEVSYMPSYNKYYPIGATVIYFNCPQILQNPIDRHLARLYVYILNMRTETLRDHASSAVNEVSFNEEAGLKITINGIPQKQDAIISDILPEISLPITAEELENAVNFYLDRIKKQNTKSGDSMLHFWFDMIKNNYLVSGKTLSNKLKKLDLPTFNRFINNILAAKKIRVLTYGSYSKQEIETISELVSEFSKGLPAPNKQDYITRFDNRLENNKTYQLNEKRPGINEQAFLTAYIEEKGGVEAKAIMIVYVMLVNSHEKKINKLGIQDHNILMGYRELGNYPAIVFSTQSNGSLQSMHDSINQYIKESYVPFERMNKYSFKEAKEDLIKQVDQTIKNLESELSYHVNNWLHRIPDEKNRISVIKHIKNVSLEDVKSIHKRLVRDGKGTHIVIQSKGEGTGNKNKRFKMIKNSTLIKPL